MKQLVILLLLALSWVACGPAPEATKPPVLLNTKEAFYNVGHALYVDRKFDSAEVYLQRALSFDASYRSPLNDLAEMHYALGMQQAGEKHPNRLAHLKKSLDYFSRLESHGVREAETYERLSELSNALDDTKALVKYAKKNADAYPYERQYFNLGFAYFQAGDYQNVIKTQKEAIEKFKGSTYTGGFYRQLGRAYTKIDRDQTAERTFDAGVKAVDAVIDAHEKPGFSSTPEYRRLLDDKVGILVSLKSLHQIYRASEKLQRVEQQLKELGHTR